MTGDPEQAVGRWLEWAMRDAERLTEADWERLIGRCLDLEPEEMADEIATFSDGELIWPRNAMSEPGDVPAVRTQTNTLLRLVEEEIPRRVYGRRANDL